MCTFSLVLVSMMSELDFVLDAQRADKLLAKLSRSIVYWHFFLKFRREIIQISGNYTGEDPFDGDDFQTDIEI